MSAFARKLPSSLTSSGNCLTFPIWFQGTLGKAFEPISIVEKGLELISEYDVMSRLMFQQMKAGVKLYPISKSLEC